MLPEWMPLEAWEAYIAMRKGMGKKYAATEYAQKLLIKKLDTWRNEGQNIEEILNQSIERAWTGLFPIKSEERKVAAWWSSDALILAKGVELGMEPLRGESMFSFKARLNKVIEHGGKERIAESRQYSLEPVTQETSSREVARMNLQAALQASKVRH